MAGLGDDKTFAAEILQRFQSFPEKYQLTGVTQSGRRLGIGGYGVVFDGRWHGARVAIKRQHCMLLRDEHGHLSSMGSRFFEEMLLHRQLSHPHVAQMLGICPPTPHYESPGLVLEYLPVTLRQRYRSEPPLTALQKADIAFGIASGLAYLHSLSMMHRNLTTNNVMLTSPTAVSCPDDEDPIRGIRVLSYVAKIVDVGESRNLATGASAQYLTRNPGSQVYMAPETREGSTEASQRAWYSYPADVYTLGVTVMAMNIGREPPDIFVLVREGRRGDVAAMSADDLMRPIVEQCLQDEPANRPTAVDVSARLTDVRERQAALVMAAEAEQRHGRAEQEQQQQESDGEASGGAAAAVAESRELVMEANRLRADQVTLTDKGETLHEEITRNAVNKVMDTNNEISRQGKMAKLRRVSLNVCGQFEAGKTSLIDNMKNKTFLLERPSTLVATVSHDACLCRNGVLEQASYTPADLDAHLDIAKAIPEERRRREEEMEEEEIVLNVAKEDSKKEPKHPMWQQFEKRVSSSNPGQESMASRTSQQDFPKRPELSMDELKKKIASDIRDIAEIMREVRDTETVMSIWDSGGQSVFSSIQHLFMSDQYVIYLLCFNAAEKLLSEKKQKFHPQASSNSMSADAKDSGKDVKDIFLPGRLRNVDHIRHWLTAIHLASGNNVPPPPVIVVGTHADQLPEGTDLQECKKELWEELRCLCKQSPLFNSMDKNEAMAESTSSTNTGTIYLIDNTISGQKSKPSPEVTALSEHIHRATEQLLQEKMVKKEWVRFEWILQHLRQQKGFPGYTDRRYLAELAQNICHINDDKELEEMLLLYNKLRLIIYRPQHKKSGDDTASATGYNPEEIIIFNMVWLIDQFNDLIFGPEFTGAEREERCTAELREHLGETGILGAGLVNKAWERSKLELQQDPGINDRLLKVLESWHMLYKCNLNGPVKYLVPCALRVSPECTILERMREGCGAGNDCMVISTADVPLIVLVQPQNYDLYGGEPDTPLPSGTYFCLLVCLMEKWGIKDGPQKVDLQYNSAWLELPPWEIGLTNFVNGRIRVFLAHYEVSGALLLSVKIQHPVGSFEEGYLRTRNNKVKISKVLCRIRGDVVSSLRQLYSDKKLALKLFLVPFPPKCDCSEDGCHVEIEAGPNQAQPGVKATDFGYFKWKMPFCGPNPFLSDTGSINPEDETWPGVTCVCGCDVEPPPNAAAWVCPKSVFKLEGKSKEEARRLLHEHRLKTTVAGLDVRHSTTSNSAGSVFVTSSPAELTDQGVATTSSSTSVHTQAASSGTACPDQGGPADVFKSSGYTEVRMMLIEDLDMSAVRIRAEGYGLITSTQLDRLSTAFPERLEHNRELFRMMEVGGTQALKTFSRRVLARMGDMFQSHREKLDQLLF